MEIIMSKKERVLGTLMGLAVGDALGVPVEFKTRGNYPPVTGMRGMGTYHQPAGTWSDDTSMALCLADALLADDLNLRSQMERYSRWLYQAEWTAHGNVFDSGNRTQQTIGEYRRSGRFLLDGEGSAGNGSIMRLAPVPMYCHARPQRVAEVYAEASSLPTHCDARCLSAARWMSAWMWRAMNGADLATLMDAGDLGVTGLAPEIAQVVAGSYRALSREQVKSGGYVVDTLEAALWALAHHSTFQETVLAAVNLGEDSDTVGAVAGQMAGALYGLSAVPSEWVRALARADDILALAEKLYAAGV
jgi:ADP-ribosyl-[dinitrogen reductase] hydrolase